MPLYRWSSGAIAQMDSTRTPEGTWRVVLRAREGASAHDLCAIEKFLGEQRIKHFIDTDEVKDTLVIPEIKNDKQLRELLEKHAFVKGEMQTITTKKDNEKLSTSAKMKKHSLMLAATLYNLGNIAYITSGIVRGKHNRDGKFTKEDWSEMMIGVTFTLGDILFTLFNPNENKSETLSFSEALTDHLKHHGVELPAPGNVTPETLHKSGFMPAVHDYLTKNIMPIKCLTEAIGGVFTVKSGLKINDGKRNDFKIAAGIMLMTGWMSTFLFDKPNKPAFEFKHDSQSQHQSTAGKLMDWTSTLPGMSWVPKSDNLPGAHSGVANWISENPRGHVARPLGMTNNILNIFGAFGEKGRASSTITRAEQRMALVGRVEDAAQERFAKAQTLLGNTIEVAEKDILKAQRVVATHEKLLVSKASRLPYYEGYLNYATRKQHDYAWNIVSACAFLSGHYFFGLSGEKKGGKNKDEVHQFENDLEMVAANVLSNVPEKIRLHAVDETAEYIAGVEGVNMNKQQIAAAILGQIERVHRSSFYTHTAAAGEHSAHVR